MVVRYSLRVNNGDNGREMCNEEDTPMEIGLIDGWRNLTTLGNFGHDADIRLTLELQFPVSSVIELQPLDSKLLSDCSLVVSPDSKAFR